MATSDWRVIYRYNPKTDDYKVIATRAKYQIDLAKSFNKRSIPILQKALANAKAHFDKQKLVKRPTSYVGGKMSSRNINSFLKAARR